MKHTLHLMIPDLDDDLSSYAADGIRRLQQHLARWAEFQERHGA